MSHIIDIAVCLFTALVSACFVLFWNFCIGEPDYDENGKPIYYHGRIFSRIGKWLINAHHNWDKAKPEVLNPYKAMGVCLLCFSVYISAIFTTASFFLLNLPAWYFLAVAVISMELVKRWQ